MESDRNLLFGVLALQAGLIDSRQFVEACSVWATRQNEPLAELLLERCWIEPAAKEELERLLRRKLERPFGDTRADTRPSPLGVPATIDLLPETRQRYALRRLHAVGGIGRVWLAYDAELDREIAIKELRPEAGHHASVGARFLREARITGQLEHPGVVPVYELGKSAVDQQPFYAMRFVKGRTTRVWPTASSLRTKTANSCFGTARPSASSVSV